MKLSKRQTEIIRTATELVSNKGFQSLTTKLLAEKIGISEPALYRHFKNKAEIIQAMIIQFDVDFEAVCNSYSGWDLVKKFFIYRIEQVIAEPQWANIMFSEELFIHTEEYSVLIKEMMHKHRNMIMENLVLAMKTGEIRNDIPPEVIFRMTAGSLRLLIKQWGFSGNAFDLQVQTNILFNAWDVLWKIK